MHSRGSHGKVLLPAWPVSSFQLGSYKPAASFSRLAPTAGSLKNYLRSPLRHSFWAAPKGPFIQFGTILPNLWQKVKYKFSSHIQGLIRPSPGGRERTRACPAPDPVLFAGGCAPPQPAVCLRRAHFLSFKCPAGGGEERGLRAVRPKVGGKTAGETPAPLFCLIGHLQGRCPVATEIPTVLRNRFSASRTSPDGPRVDRHF